MCYKENSNSKCEEFRSWFHWKLLTIMLCICAAMCWFGGNISIAKLKKFHELLDWLHRSTCKFSNWF